MVVKVIAVVAVVAVVAVGSKKSISIRRLRLCAKKFSLRPTLSCFRLIPQPYQ